MPDLARMILADRYVIERELGRGGMATVWLARDRQHERFVAIKVLHPELAGAIWLDRFVREVRLTASLKHPNIVSVIDSGVLHSQDGTTLPWYAMAWLEGESLRARLARECQLPVAEAVEIAGAVGSALEASHRAGIVHRDIKPENIFLSDGHVYVVDFGIAKALLQNGGERLTSTGLAIGTPAYMSPEQAMADPVDARTDQYSLATVLYEMLAGEAPFSGATAQAIVARRLAERARPLIPVRPTVPIQVERAILKALERSPADRFPHVRAFTLALLAESAPTPVPPRRLLRQSVLSAALLTAIVAGGWLFTMRARSTPPRIPDPELIALFQRGSDALTRRTPRGLTEAVQAFASAVGRDSSFAPGWTGLAKAYRQAYQRSFAIHGLTGDSLLQRALVASDRSLAIDSSSSEAWLARAMVSKSVEPTDPGPSLRLIRRALSLDSTNAGAWHFLGTLLSETGDLDAGMDAWRRCVALAPANTECLAFLGLGHYWRRRYDSAAAWADSAIAVEPNYLLGRQVAGNIAVERGDFAKAASAFDAARRVSTGVEAINSLAGSALAAARAGRSKEARAILRKVDSMATGLEPFPLHTAVYASHAFAALGEPDMALAWLARYEPLRDLHYQFHLLCDPPFDPLRSVPRFQSLLLRGVSAC